MTSSEKIQKIVNWLTERLDSSGCEGFVVGVSGGIDSAVTSTLCSLTGRPVTAISMSIHQAGSQVSRSDEHLDWLIKNFQNVIVSKIDLTTAFESFKHHCQTWLRLEHHCLIVALG